MIYTNSKEKNDYCFDDTEIIINTKETIDRDLIPFLLEPEKTLQKIEEEAKKENTSAQEIIAYYLEKGIKSETEIDDFNELLRYKKGLYSKKQDQQIPRILIDASLIQDVLLKRDSVFLKNGQKILDLVLNDKISGYISEIGLRDIYDNTLKMNGKEDANFSMIKLLNYFYICNISPEIIEKAHFYKTISIESAIKIECAKRDNIDIIITLREKDFLAHDWKKNVLNPSQFLSEYDKHQFQKSSSEELDKEVEDSLSRLKLNKELYPEDYAKEELSLFDDEWVIQHFNVLTAKNNICDATVFLAKKGDKKTDAFRAWDEGSIAALSRALDKAIKEIKKDQAIKYTIEDITERELEQGLDSSIYASVTLKFGNSTVEAYHIHKDTIKAHFYAYVKAINLIYDAQKDSQSNNYEGKKLISLIMPVNEDTFIQLYRHGRLLGEKKMLDFLKMNLREINLVGKKLSGINLSYSDLTDSNLEHINLSNSSLESCLLERAKLFHATLKDCTLFKANLRGAKLNKAILSKSNLSRADLTEADLDNAILKECDLTSANLTSVILKEAILIGAYLNKANLTNAELIEANLTSADLTNVNLTDADLSGADLSGANLTGAILNKCNLTNANLTNANLTNANLTDAKLSKANLSKCNLTSANLTDAELIDAEFNNTNLSDTNLTDAKLISNESSEIFDFDKQRRQLEENYANNQWFDRYEEIEGEICSAIRQCREQKEQTLIDQVFNIYEKGSAEEKEFISLADLDNPSEDDIDKMKSLLDKIDALKLSYISFKLADINLNHPFASKRKLTKIEWNNHAFLFCIYYFDNPNTNKLNVFLKLTTFYSDQCLSSDFNMVINFPSNSPEKKKGQLQGKWKTQPSPRIEQFFNLDKNDPFELKVTFKNQSIKKIKFINN
ncbi:pentapeptide repeat-containing protein [Geminocystis sp. NIES-3709]|uniref:pentapeptide repeat-containing protein n=1 Tax=Geminocystis sp. NIES-3709 TaxID=1617448 RepID=UPI000A6DBBDC|nr:pentapeptide repeat-containing protein [Geminocystis sp. NIES-3709]